MKVCDQEYILVVCETCGDRCKIAKNKGADWWCGTFNKNFKEFLLKHSCCESRSLSIDFLEA